MPRRGQGCFAASMRSRPCRQVTGHVFDERFGIWIQSENTWTLSDKSNKLWPGVDTGERVVLAGEGDLLRGRGSRL